MSRRFHPDGKGWIRVVDYGDCAAWLRPSQDGLGVEAVIYMPNWNLEGSARPWEVWEAYEPTPVRHLDEIFNKIHRLRHFADPDFGNDTWADGEPRDPADVAHDRAVTWSARRVPASHRGHRRLNRKRRIYLGRMSSFHNEPEYWRHHSRAPRKLRKALYG